MGGFRGGAKPPLGARYAIWCILATIRSTDQPRVFLQFPIVIQSFQNNINSFIFAPHSDPCCFLYPIAQYKSIFISDFSPPMLIYNPPDFCKLKSSPVAVVRHNRRLLQRLQALEGPFRCPRVLSASYCRRAVFSLSAGALDLIACDLMRSHDHDRAHARIVIAITSDA